MHTGSRLRTAAAAAVLLFVPIVLPSAYADSDGYYCVGRHYLAYQFVFSIPPVGHHRLYVLRLDTPSHIEPPAAFDLPEFQVHGMRCDEQLIELVAWDAVYTVHLDSTNRAVRYDRTPRDSMQPISARFGTGENLGAWNRTANNLKTERVPLATLSGGRKLQLQISGRRIASERCWSMVTTHVVRTDRNGRDVERRQIFRGRASRECGE
jgi:hypothetical protein